MDGELQPMSARIKLAVVDILSFYAQLAVKRAALRQYKRRNKPNAIIGLVPSRGARDLFSLCGHFLASLVLFLVVDLVLLRSLKNTEVMLSC